jgi:hypothetical protein
MPEYQPHEPEREPGSIPPEELLPETQPVPLRERSPQEVVEAVRRLLSDVVVGASAETLLSVEDLKLIATDPTQPPEVRDAARARWREANERLRNQADVVQQITDGLKIEFPEEE